MLYIIYSIVLKWWIFKKGVFMNQLAIVTGASSGIGFATCLALIERGIRVLGVARRADKLAFLKKLNPNMINTLSADVSTKEGRKAILNALSNEQPRTLSYVVHCAGVLTPVGPLSSINEEAWRQTMAINVEAPLFLTKALIPCMKKGRILHISSGAAHFPIIHWTAYCASKAALFQLYQCLNLELKGTHIVVGSLAPGIVDTPMQDSIRDFDAKQFPDVEKFIKYQQEHTLIPAKKTAALITHMLLDTTETAFSEKEWDGM